MKCPCCGNDMETGYLLPGGANPKPMVWAGSAPGWFTKPKGQIRLDAPDGDTIASMLSPVYRDSHICKSCKTVVFQYK